MTRKLTQDEKDFIDETLKKREIKKEKRETIKKAKYRTKKNRPRRFFQKPGFWITIVMSIPTIITMFILYAFARVESVIGPGSLNLLSKKEITPELKEISTYYGVSWMPELIELYSNRGYIIAGIFTIGIIISLLILVIDLLFFNKKEEQENHD